MNATNDSNAVFDLTRFDVRTIPCREKHARIFQKWAELPVGAHFVLVNDHDPVPLYYQFAAQFPGAFSWDYLVAGPDEFQVKITRTAENPAVAITAPPPRSCGAHRREAAPPGAGHRAILDGEVDARGLEPPEPMMVILAAAELLVGQARLRARTDRRPVHLFPELTARGFAHSTEEMTDGSWITTLWRA